MKKLLGFLFLAFTLVTSSFGSHILGGEITYRYLGSDGPASKPFRYQIRFVGYVDRVGDPSDPSNWGCGNLTTTPLLAIYDAATNQRIPRTENTNQPLLVNYLLPSHGPQIQGICPIDPYYGGMRPVIIKKPVSCIVPGLDQLNIAITDTTFIVELPFSASGYKIRYENCCRSGATTNISFGGPSTNDDPGNTWLAEIPSPIFANSSPQFLEDAVPFFCNGDTTTIANNASDPDGDRLIYSFVTPYSAGFSNQPPPTYTPPTFVTYNAGFSTTMPFGPSGYAFINPSTGLTKYYSNVNGNFAVAIEIQEYRTLSNGIEILISSTRREFLIVVKDCAPNPAPTPNPIPGFSNGGILTVSEGDSVKFTISSEDVDTTTISVISDLITGQNGYNGSLAVCPEVTGVGLVSTTFKWKVDCGLTKGLVRSYPVNVRFEDKGCPPKVNNVIYTLVVNPFKAPTITGRDSICSTDTIVQYSVPSGVGRKWRVSGGNIVGIDTTSTIQVHLQSDTARLWIVATSGQGCKDSTSKLIRRIPLVPIVATAPKSLICQDSLVTLNAAGGYTSVSWSPTVGLSSGDIRNPVATLTDTIQYFVTSNGPAGCVARDSIRLTWIPNVANAGADSILCSGLSRGVGSEQNTGYNYYSYQWSPALGLESDTSFLTTANLQNNGTGIQTFTYVQTATHRESGCLSTDTVILSVKPLPAVDAGVDSLVICSGGVILLGTVDTTASRFEWSPAEGLFSPDKDTTSASLLNAGPDPSYTKYTLTKTEILMVPLPGEQACFNSDSIWLKVNPLPDFVLASNDSICSGFSTEIGTDYQTGFSYAWMPPAGLSHPDSSKTNVTWSNPGNIPVDSVYQLTVTNLGTSCKMTKDLIFRINPLPVVFAGLDTNICSGDTIKIGEAPESGFSYAWEPSGNIIDTTQGNPLVSIQNPNTGGAGFTVSLNVIKLNNQTLCRNFDTLQIFVNPLPAVFAAASDTLTICSGGTVQLGQFGLPNHIYEWTPDSALTSPNASDPVVSITNPSQITTYHLYSLQATNINTTCKNKDEVTIAVNPLPIVPLVYTDTAVCSKDTIRIGGDAVGEYNYAWTPNLILSDTSSSLPYFVTVNNADTSISFTYQLLVTNSLTGCQESKSVNVHVNPLPDADAGPDVEVCSRDSVQIGLPPLPGRRYAWNPETGLSDPTISNPKVSLVNNGNTPQTFTYTLTVFDMTKPTQCDSSDEMVVTVKPLPVAVAASQDTVNTCATVSLQLGITGDPLLQYAWNPPAGLSEDTISNPVLTLNTGNETSPALYVLTVQDPATGCQKKDSVMVRIYSLPNVVLGTLDSLCSGDTVLLGPSTGLIGPNYLWTPSTGLATPGNFNSSLTLVNPSQNVVVNPYQLLVTNPVTGCKDSATIQVRINPLPIANAGTDTTVCSGSQAQLGINNTVINWSFLWNSDPGINNPGISNPLFSAIAPGQPRKDTLQLTVTNTLTQCSNRDQVIVTTNPRPGPVVFGIYSPVVCPFTPNVPYTITNGEPGQTYQWSVSGGAIQSGGNSNSINVNWGGVNPAAQVTVIPLNEFSCSGPKDSLTITLNQNLNPAKPLGDTVLCSYSKTGKIYSTIPTPGSNYTWKYVGATVDSNVTALGQTLVDWAINDGVAKIWIAQQSSTIDPTTQTPVQCFGNSDTLFVRINPSPDSTLNIGGLSAVCTNSASIENLTLNGFAGSSFNWSINPLANIISGQGTGTIAVNWNTPGSYAVSVLETSDKGCIGRPINKTVTVNPVPTPGLAENTDLKVCPGDQNKNYVALPSPGFVNSTFTWTLTGGVTTSPNNEPQVTVQWDNSGVYALVLRETSAEGCFKDSTIALDFDPSNVVLQNVSLLESDENQVELTFNMNNQATNPGGINVWRKELLAADNAWEVIVANVPKNITTYLDQPGATATKAYQYKVSTNNACAKTVESNVHNTILLSGMAHNEDGISHLKWNPYIGWPSGPGSYELLRKVDSELTFSSFDNGIPNSATIEKEYESGPDGFKQCFRVVARENQGNSRSFSNSICLNFENQLVFYNLITPNGDGKNDSWNIPNLRLYPENELEVYDRWGKKVFTAKNYSEDNLWDGKGLSAGVYFYRFSVPGRSLEYNGYVQIER